MSGFWEASAKFKSLLVSLRRTIISLVPEEKFERRMSLEISLTLINQIVKLKHSNGDKVNIS